MSDRHRDHVAELDAIETLAMELNGALEVREFDRLGGTLLVDCLPENGERLAKAMADCRKPLFQLRTEGSKVIFNDRREVSG